MFAGRARGVSYFDEGHLLFTDIDSRSMRRAVFIASLFCAMPRQTCAQSFTVEWSSQRLTVIASDVPLASVLADIARKTNSQFHGIEQITDTVWIEFHDKTLRDGLRLLLSRVSYVLDAETDPDHPNRGARAWLQMAPAIESPVSRDVSAPVAAAAEPVPVESVTEPHASGLSPRDTEAAELETSGYFNTDAPVGQLLTAVRSDNAAIRARALHTLGMQRAAVASDVMKEALLDPDPEVRSTALALLTVNADGPSGVRELGDLLSHQDPAVRLAALSALSGRTGSEAEFQMKRALDDEDPGVRAMASGLWEGKEAAASDTRTIFQK